MSIYGVAAVGIRYGKFCGVGWSGCEGEEPCDDLDACCRHHDKCVQKKVHATSSVNDDADLMFNCSPIHRIDTKSDVLLSLSLLRKNRDMEKKSFHQADYMFCRCEVLDRLVLFCLLSWSISHIACNRVI